MIDKKNATYDKKFGSRLNKKMSLLDNMKDNKDAGVERNSDVMGSEAGATIQDGSASDVSI